MITASEVSKKPGAVQKVPRNCVIVSADWGRDVSKRAVYVGRCEPS